MIAGVDGCRSGWVAVLDDGRERRVEVFATFADLLRTGARTIVIDVPIGLMDDRPRAADAAARKLLRGRASCVFPAPYRAMLGARSHAEACAVRERIDGKRCSRQAFGIFRKIAEVDARMTPELQERVVEGHPEVTFALLRGTPVEHGKKSAEGRAARVAVLREHFPEVEERVASRRPAGVGRDDLLDAYALLWTASRVVAGAEVRLPGGTVERDARGLRAEIVA